VVSDELSLSAFSFLRLADGMQVGGTGSQMANVMIRAGPCSHRRCMMAIHTQMQVIDADAHVVETERTWDYLEASEQKYRSLLYASLHDPVSQYWVMGFV
jgi:hypothetical protein